MGKKWELRGNGYLVGYIIRLTFALASAGLAYLSLNKHKNMEKTDFKDPISESLQHAGEATDVSPEIVELNQDRVASDTEIEPEEFLMEFNGMPCFPRCDVSVLTGQAKAGKTSLTAMIMACCACKEVLMLKRKTEQPLKVLWLDTEQSLATTQRILKEKVGRLIEGEFPEELFYVFNTRRRTPKERCERLALAIKTYRPDIAIIDGIADLTDDINSGPDSNELMQQLLSMAQEYKCNITVNIHLNRNGAKQDLRGWLGTLILQKSYEVFTCEKMADGETLTVSMLFSRLRSVNATMYYRMDKNGLPYLAKNSDSKTATTKVQEVDNRFNPEYVDQNAKNKSLPWQFRKLFEAAFGSACMLGYDDLERRIMELGWIKRRQYYNRVLAEAEEQRIVKKTLTKDGRVGVIIFAAQ